MAQTTQTATTAGRFVWRTLNTTDLPAARKFYSQLFGWSAGEVDMGPAGKYTMFRDGDRDVAGAAALDPAAAAAGARPHWLAYPSVDDVDAVADRVPAVGGRILVPPTDIPNVGRFCVAADAQGAVVAPFTGKPGAPQGPDGPPAVGSFCWDELHTTDTTAAKSYYGKLIGWTSRSIDMGPAGSYTMFQRSDKDLAGMVALPTPPSFPSAWLSYVLVRSVDASTDKARGLGAKVMMEPKDIPGMGRFSVLIDPTGAAIALWVAQPK
jgi:predicted enzyme related to lactoylglutathione lyase